MQEHYCKIVRDDEPPVKITVENLRDFLDMSPVKQKNVNKRADSGVVTDLAWTSVGGDVLYIETKKMDGTGKLTITGQLGGVMKESAQIALSLVRTLYADQVELQSGEVYKFVIKGKEKDKWKNLIMEYAKKREVKLMLKPLVQRM